MEFIKSIFSAMYILFISIFPKIDSNITTLPPVLENKKVEIVSTVEKNSVQENKKVVIPTKIKEEKKSNIALSPSPVLNPVNIPVISVVDQLPNNQISLPPIVNPIVNNVPIPTIEVVQPTNLQPVTEVQPQMPTPETYIVTKNGETVLSNVLIEEVRTFVYNLNNYISWKKKVKIATVEELDDMLISNGYALDKN